MDGKFTSRHDSGNVYSGGLFPQVKKNKDHWWPCPPVILVFLAILMMVVNGWAGCRFGSDYSGSVKSNYRYCPDSYCPSGAAGYTLYNNNYLYKCWRSGDYCYWQQVAYCTGNSQSTVDSLNCIKAGNNWQNGVCKSCTQPDSTWGECATIYKYSQKYGATIPISQVRKFQRKDCEETETSRETIEGKTCDNILVPDSSSVKCYATMGTTVYLQNGLGQIWACKNADGSCDYAQRKYEKGECPPPNDTTTTPPPEGGGDGASSSSAPESSSSSQENDSAININDLEFIKDSFYMVDTNLLKIRDQMDVMGADLNHTANTTDQLLLNSYDQKDLLRQIANKDLSVNVPRDTIVNNINVRGPSYDDSGVKNRLDSILAKMGANNDKADTNGVGAILGNWQAKTDNISDSVDGLGLSLNFWDDCDTTGGKECSKKFIGTHGLDSAKSSYANKMKSLSDSLVNGAVGDSLNGMKNAITNNGVLQGSGNDVCPEPLNRETSAVIFGETEMKIRFGKYLCAPIMDGVTPWKMARIILRMLVAIACMWWIYKQVTGTGGDDEN